MTTPEEAGRSLVHEVRDLMQHVQIAALRLQRSFPNASNEAQAILLGLLERVEQCRTNTESLQEDIPVSRTRPLRIVVVEDSPIIRSEIVRWLVAKGHEIVGEASLARQMVQMTLDRKPDMVVFDIGLPDGDGITAFREIMKSYVLPAVVITGHSDVDLMMGKTDGLIYGYNVKPVSEAQLDASVKVAWARWQEYKQLASEKAEVEETLTNRKFIERAKGILMEQRRWSEGTAFKKMQKASRHREMKMVELAKGIIAGKLWLIDIDEKKE